MWNGKKRYSNRSQQQKHQQHLRCNSSLLQLLSHCVWSILFFRLGTIYREFTALCPAAVVVVQNATANSSRPANKRRRDEQLYEGYVTNELGTEMDTVRVKQDVFLQAFDLGMPWESRPGDVLLLYATANNSQATRTMQQASARSIPTHVSMVEDAVERCNVLKTVVTDRAASCLAIVNQNDSYHVHKWMRLGKKKKQWQSVSRYGGTDASLQYPPKPVNTKESMQLLQQYLTI